MQVINLSSSYVLTLRFLLLEADKSPILLAGGDDGKLSVYNHHKLNFTKSLSLTGHEDWLLNIHASQDGKLVRKIQKFTLL